jgi:5-methylcytosine-specific restriction enzyme A
MARTQGHGNRDWTRDETILALALYFECGEIVPPKSDPRLQELSTLLRSLPYHSDAARKPTFRNPDGVGFKLHNLRSVATGKGLGNTSKTDRDIWETFGSAPAQVRELAALIKLSVTLRDADAAMSDEDQEEFFEGRVLTLMHKRRERHYGLRKALLDSRRKTGPFACDLCGIGPVIDDPELSDAQFEAHHLIPLAAAVERKTHLRDMALVCANCHRLIHRLIIQQKRWLTLDQRSVLLRPETRPALETLPRLEDVERLV